MTLYILADDGQTPIRVTDHIAWADFMTLHQGSTYVTRLGLTEPLYDICTAFTGIDLQDDGMLWGTVIVQLGAMLSLPLRSDHASYTSHAAAMAGHVARVEHVAQLIAEQAGVPRDRVITMRI